MQSSSIDKFHATLVAEIEKLVESYDINCIGLLFPNQGPVGVVQLRGLFAERLSVPTVVIRINERLIRNQIWFERNDIVHSLLSPQKRVLLFCDAATSGASIYRAALIVRKFGAECGHALAVFDRLQGASERLRTKGVELISLIDRDVFQQHGKLNASDIAHDMKASRFEFESIRATL